MRRKSSGFTLIEVSLFLAVTGLLFLSVTIGVQNSIYQQRYNDAVQSYTDFLRNVYTEVMNVQSISSGRHELAIYGKLISFRGNNDEGKQNIYVYDVIGEAVSSNDIGSDTTLTLLGQLGADVIFREKSTENYQPVGIIEMYEPNWGARIQTTDKNRMVLYTGAVLIIRDPRSGTMRTFVANQTAADAINSKLESLGGGSDTHVLTSYLTPSNFVQEEVDFCVNPSGMESNNRRTDVRILKGAANSSGVEVIDLDDKSANGNRCNE